MSSSDRDPSVERPLEAQSRLTLEDLLASESSVLRRLGQEQTTNTPTTAHYSNTGGHNSSGGHSSHTSAKIERPLE
jgi:hypothetical protein